MPEEEKKEEDIIKKLEELRKRPKAEEAVKSAPAVIDEDAAKKKRARMIGAVVVLLVIAGLFFFGYQRIISPLRKEAQPQGVSEATAQPTAAPATPKPSGVLTESEYKTELEKAKSAKIDEATSLLAGLPVEFGALKDDLVSTVRAKNRIEEVKAIDVASISTEIWREAKRRDVDKKQRVGDVVIAYLYHNSTPSYDIIKGAENIKKFIEILSIEQLKSLEIKPTNYEYIPIRLPRERAGGFVGEGDKVSIYYRENLAPWALAPNTTPSMYSSDERSAGFKNISIRHLVKDGRVIGIMRAQSSGTITLSESELKSDTGGGAEGKGTVPSISIGSLGSITNESGFGASIGYKMRQTSTAYSVNLGEIQKAAAAGKISEKELMQSLEKYGVKLSEFERQTNLGSFDEEFLMLVEVTEEETKTLVPRLLDSKERENLFITISAIPSWAK